MGAPWVGIRWHADTGFELRCELCARAKLACWWPLTLEFWDPSKGMTRCRSCWAAYQRAVRRGENRTIVRQLPTEVLQRQEARRAYCREWQRRRRARERAA